VSSIIIIRKRKFCGRCCLYHSRSKIKHVRDCNIERTLALRARFGTQTFSSHHFHCTNAQTTDSHLFQNRTEFGERETCQGTQGVQDSLDERADREDIKKPSSEVKIAFIIAQKEIM